MNRRYRKTVIAGNWKMNMTATETKKFAEDLKKIMPRAKWCETLICVPACNIQTAAKAFKDLRISVGAENVYFEEKGAYTGEVSADMLKDLGVKYVIVGHSERRQYFCETDTTVNKKVHAVLNAGMNPIICVGESLEQRETGITNEWIALQVKSALYGVPADKLDLAYGYIPRGDIEETTDGRTGPDPELAYAGDPAAGLGFYCFAQPVAQGANAYLAAQGSALRAADITGVTGQGLLQYLRGGDPVIVWITKDLSAPRTGGCTWLLADTGETYVPYANLHCVVLAGWDGDTCTIADPLQGRRRVDAAAFLQCFRQMGSRAVVVH